MMSVSVEVAIPNESKKNFSISPFETIKNHLLDMKMIYVPCQFFFKKFIVLELEPVISCFAALCATNASTKLL
jgi:hypothetical protein